MIKRIICAVFAVLLLLGCAGCKGNDNGDAANTTTGSAAGATTGSSAENTTAGLGSVTEVAMAKKFKKMLDNTAAEQVKLENSKYDISFYQWAVQYNPADELEFTDADTYDISSGPYKGYIVFLFYHPDRAEQIEIVVFDPETTSQETITGTLKYQYSVDELTADDLEININGGDFDMYDGTARELLARMINVLNAYMTEKLAD